MSVLSKAALQSAINAQITTNGTGSITGAQLNAILNNMVDSYQDYIEQLDTAEIGALTPSLNQIVYNTDTNYLMQFNGTSWVALAAIFIGTTAEIASEPSKEGQFFYDTEAKLIRLGTGVSKIRLNDDSCFCVKLYHDNYTTGTKPNATGTNAVAIGLEAVATSVSSVAIGTYANADGDVAFAIGEEAEATEQFSYAFGKEAVSEGIAATALGVRSNAVGEASMAYGSYSVSRLEGGHAFAFNFQNKQKLFLGAFNETADNTPTKLFLDGTAARIVIPSNTLWTGNVKISGYTTDGAEVGVYERRIALKHIGGTVTLVNSQTIGSDYESDASWSVTISADDTNKALDIEVVGHNSLAVLWFATIEVNEIIIPL